MEEESRKPGSAIADDHTRWQVRLAERFFPSDRAGQSVRLNIDPDDFPIEDGDIESLLRAVHDEAKAHGCNTVLELLESQARQFQTAVKVARELGGALPAEPPGVLPGLVVLVLAVHHGGKRFDEKEYYDRLRDLMGYGSSADINSGPMKRAELAWTVLEEWSCRLQMGRRGLFEVRVLGGKRYVGVPLRQALLSPSDEGALEHAFAHEGLEPDRHLASGAAFRLAKGASLRARARMVLEGYPYTPASRELIDCVVAVYEDWDGSEHAGSNITARRRPIRIRFQEQFPRLENVVATCVLPIGTQSKGTDDPQEIRVESAEWRDGGCELMRKDGTSLADTMDWFETVKTELETLDGRSIECFRRRSNFRLFTKQGNTWIEQFEDELEADRTYAEIRQGNSLTDSPGAGGGSFCSTAWKLLEAPVGLNVRLFRLEPSTGVLHNRRLWGRTRGGIKFKGRTAVFFAFALPDIVWSHPKTVDLRVIIRSINGQGEVVDERSIEPEGTKFDAGGLGVLDRLSEVGVEVGIQATVDEIVASGTPPTVVEAFIENEESNSKVRVYPQGTDAAIQIPDPPRRNSIGELDETGLLSGPVGRTDASSVAPAVTQLGAPLVPNSSLPRLDAPSDKLCRLLRSQGAIPWGRARDQIRQCGQDDSFNDLHNVTSQLFSLHQLGVLEVVEATSGGLDRVQALPPRLAITAGKANLGMIEGRVQSKRRFLLTGAWLPREIRQLHQLITDSSGMTFHHDRTTDDETLIPPYRCVLLDREDARAGLRVIASRLKVQFEDQVPDSVSSLASTAPLSEVRESLDWRSGKPGAGYEVFEFDPGALCRSNTRDDGRQLRLFECKRRDSGQWVFFLFDNSQDQFAVINDRQLGRWLVRRDYVPEAPLPVDSKGAVLVPLELRLPRHLERILGLGSGRAPETVWFDSSHPSPFLHPDTADKFQFPQPTSMRVRPYQGFGRCSHAFIRYPNAYGTSLWPASTAMPILEANVARVSTIGLKGGSR